jgi:hypothetical protein
VADFSQGVRQSQAQAQGVLGQEVGHHSLSRMAYFFNSQHDAGDGIVVIIADADCPRESRCIVNSDKVGFAKGVIID